MTKKITDFLGTKTSKDQLRIALRVLEEFKNCESREKFLLISLSSWAKLEQLEEFLNYLVFGHPLKKDTVAYIEGRRLNMTQTVKITENRFNDIKNWIQAGASIDVLNKKYCPLIVSVRPCSTSCAFSSTFIGKVEEGMIIEFRCRKNVNTLGRGILICKAKVEEEK